MRSMMPLLDIRKQFIVYSGRYDLIVDQIDYVDNGADYFIRAGQRWLDRFGHIYKAEARWYQTLHNGEWFTPLPSRTIREVWMSDTSGNKWKLKKQEYRHLRKCFSTDPALVVPSTPKFYAYTPLRTIPEASTYTIFDRYDGKEYTNRVFAEYVTLQNELGDVYTLLIDSAHQSTMIYGVAPSSYEGAQLKDKYDGAIYNAVQMTAFNNPTIPLWLQPDSSGQLIVSTSPPSGSILDVGAQLDLISVILSADYITCTTIGEHTVHVGADVTPSHHYAHMGLVWMPPATEGLELEVIGAFYQPDLLLDEDVNFWSEENPNILVMAACRQLEISYRNKEGTADWELAIKNEILGLEMDLAELESNEFTQMEG